MSGGRFDLERAKHDTEIARAQLADTIGEIANRFSPKVLLGQAWEEVRDMSGLVADDAVKAVKAVKDRPLALSGIAAAIGLFLARKPIASAFSRRRSKNGTGEDVGEPVTTTLDDDTNYALSASRVAGASEEGAKT